MCCFCDEILLAGAAVPLLNTYKKIKNLLVKSGWLRSVPKAGKKKIGLKHHILRTERCCKSEDGKPVGSSKRVGRGRNKGKLPLNARYFATEKRLKRKKTPKKGRELGMEGTGGGRSVPPFPQSYFPKKTYASLDESQTRGKTKTTIFSGTWPFRFFVVFFGVSKLFPSTSRSIFHYVLTSKIFAVKPKGPSLHCCVHSRKWKLAVFSPPSVTPLSIMPWSRAV